MNSKLNKNYDLKKLISFVDDRPGHDFRYSINNSKLKNFIKWNPNIEFYNGLEKTIDWYLEKFKRKNLKLL